MLHEATASREAAVKDAAALIESAKQEAARLGAEAQAEAEAAAVRREKMVMDRIASAEQAAVREVREAAIEVATDAARSVLARVAAEHDPVMIDQAIAGLPKALAQRAA
jgi:F-type H+-transporting ATPase subunit b